MLIFVRHSDVTQFKEEAVLLRIQNLVIFMSCKSFQSGLTSLGAFWVAGRTEQRKAKLGAPE